MDDIEIELSRSNSKLEATCQREQSHKVELRLSTAKLAETDANQKAYMLEQSSLRSALSRKKRSAEQELSKATKQVEKLKQEKEELGRIIMAGHDIKPDQSSGSKLAMTD